MARKLTVEIADYAGQVWAGEAAYVSAPSGQGPVGIYPRHQPLLALLGQGNAKIELEDGGGVVEVQVNGGFLSVDSDIVTLVADEATLLGSGSV